MMNLAFVFNPRNPYLNFKRAQVNMRKFFFDALPRVANVTFYGEEDELDLTPHADKHDAWIFFDAVEWGIPRRLKGVGKLKAPKVCMIGDCHGAEKRSEAYGMTKRQCCEMWDFDAYFFQHTPGYFYQFFPVDWTYWWIPFGVDAELYREVRPWAERRRDKVLLTGVLGPEFYPLRTRLAKDPRIHYHVPGSYSGYDGYAPGQFDGDRYKLLLEGWGGTVASGYSVLAKYFEAPAAGCLTFAHIDGDNGCEIIGFRNGETAVGGCSEEIDQVVDTYLAAPDDPAWGKIAANGRRYVMENFTHDRCAQRLVDAIGGLI